MLLNPKTGHVSPQFHVVFDGKFSKVIFIREVIITPNFIDTGQPSSQIGVPENIDLKDKWFTP